MSNSIKACLAAALLCVFIFWTAIFAQPAPCSGRSGKDIVACVAARYPERLVANVTLAERTANMEFLRNRIIETGRCAALDLGLNLKRGGPEVSKDFVAWKTNGRVEGVDIAQGYDDTKKALRLQWHTYTAPNYGHPFYKAYGPVVCVGQPAPEPTPTPVPGPEPAPSPVFDPTPLFTKIEQLEKLNTQLAADIAILHSRIENAATQAEEDRKRIFTLETKQPQVYRCEASVYGLPIRCRVIAEVNP